MSLNKKLVFPFPFKPTIKKQNKTKTFSYPKYLDSGIQLRVPSESSDILLKLKGKIKAYCP